MRSRWYHIYTHKLHCFTSYPQLLELRQASLSPVTYPIESDTTYCSGVGHVMKNNLKKLVKMPGEIRGRPNAFTAK